MYKFQVTTRKEILESLKDQGYYLIGLDGTVPNGELLYDELYDHHKSNGADIQIEELMSLNIRFLRKEGIKICFVTTQVDADAICAAYYFINRVLKEHFYIGDGEKFLKAISYDCDHLGVPKWLSSYAEDAAMIVAALKEVSTLLIAEFGLNPDRKAWTIEEKELYASKAFEQGVRLIELAIKGEWNYKAIAAPYWEKVEANTQMIVENNRIKEYKDCLIFDAKGLGGQYIDPRCWLRAAKQLGIEPKLPVTLTQREVIVENKLKGYSYTLGCVPLHPKLNSLDYTKQTFGILTKAEKKINPDADGWGGRKTVGGSGWNTPSNLLAKEVIDLLTLSPLIAKAM
jgi:hypothetical protein